MRNIKLGIRVITMAAAASVLLTTAFAQQPRTVAIWPWTFDGGTKTSHETAIETVRKIAERQGFTVLPHDATRDRYGVMGFHKHMPGVGELTRFAADVHAHFVFFGNVKWHTRSIWVGTGPKTISTATVVACVFNADSGAITLRNNGEGRSDEKESTLKDVLDVVVTPLITVVSGGPATPHEQRAVQIAMNRALRGWLMQQGGQTRH